MRKARKSSEDIEIPIEMNMPNKIINIYKGEFKLISNNEELIVNGLIKFDWFPNNIVSFKGKTKDSEILLNLFHSETDLDLMIDNILFCKCEITSCNLTNLLNKNNNLNVEGLGIDLSIFGDKSISVQKVRFAIPNLRNIKGNTFTEWGYINDRKLTFENNEYSITIEKIRNFHSQNELLQRKGGYILLYSGEITKLRECVSLADSSNLLLPFSHFLNFLNGRRCSPIFRKGLFNEDTIWCDYTPYFVDQYKAVISWIPKNSSEGLNHIWEKFSTLWKTQKDFLITAIHWYLEANAHSGLTDGSIIMIQTGLELIYNWLLVEQKKFIIGKDAESISAANKIRLLLSLLSISNEVPVGLRNLKELVDNNKEITDAPEALVQIRNAVVHSQSSKRSRIASMGNTVKYEALQLGLWYMELSLLYILGYEDKYSNRCLGQDYTYGSEILVPWVRRNK